MANEINGSKAVPLGYMLCDKLDADMISDALRNAMINLDHVGATVIAVTFDGLPANKSAAEKLGANLNVDSPAFKTHFPHPVTKEPVFCNLDSSHMFKLMRNQLQDCGSFFDENDNVTMILSIMTFKIKKNSNGIVLIGN